MTLNQVWDTTFKFLNLETLTYGCYAIKVLFPFSEELRSDDGLPWCTITVVLHFL